MQVLHVCSEMFPLLKTGGLADVIGALPAAQIADGVDARVLLPAFPDIRRGVTDAQDEVMADKPPTVGVDFRGHRKRLGRHRRRLRWPRRLSPPHQ